MQILAERLVSALSDEQMMMANRSYSHRMFSHLFSFVLFVCSPLGLCKKGADVCESLHVYDLSRMPLCQFIVEYGSCHSADCMFSHTKEEEKEQVKKECMWYSRGFCKLGPNCKSKHVKKEMCPDYLGQSAEQLVSSKFILFRQITHRGDSLVLIQILCDVLCFCVVSWFLFSRSHLFTGSPQVAPPR